MFNQFLTSIKLDGVENSQSFLLCVGMRLIIRLVELLNHRAPDFKTTNFGQIAFLEMSIQKDNKYIR